ncbi:MAG TPA: hypothetical protein VF131_17100 [Blastocatellia bacterium]|nr:hypothetical protein [Blastocatellia bacterium]
MSKRLLIQRAGILLILLVTCSPVICQSTKNNPSQNKPSSQKAPQKASDELKIDPAIFELKELLYFDTKLDVWVNKIPETFRLRTESLRENPELKELDSFNENYGQIAEAVLLIQKGNPKQAEKALESNTDEKLKQELDYWMALAYAKQQAGDLVGARNSIRQIFTLPVKETAIHLLAWSMLRQLGEKPDERIANEVLGVIVEVGMGNTVVVVAGFADGMPRLWVLAGGGGPIGSVESFPNEITMAAKKMVNAAQPLVNTFPLEKDRQLPKQGRIRFALLTAGGTHVREESIDQLDNRKSPALYALNLAAQELFTSLMKYNLEQSKKP